MLLRLFILTLTVASACAGIKDGLAGYWDFENSLNDRVGRAHGKGHKTKGYVKSHPGLGFAINLRQPGMWVECANESQFDFETAVAVSCWVRVDSFSARHSGIVMKGEGPSAGPVFRLQCASKQHEVEFGYGKSGPEVAYELRNKGWHHLVGQYDEGTGRCQIWINGQLKLNVVDKRPLGVNNATLRFGGNVSEKQWFNGDLDEVAVWGRVLTGAEVKAIWNGGKGRTIASLRSSDGDAFRLRLPGSKAVLGPFVFAQDQEVNLAGKRFRIQLAGAKQGTRRFHLVSKTTGSSFGPFGFVSGSELRIGGLTCEVLFP